MPRVSNIVTILRTFFRSEFFAAVACCACAAYALGWPTMRLAALAAVCHLGFSYLLSLPSPTPSRPPAGPSPDRWDIPPPEERQRQVEELYAEAARLGLWETHQPDIWEPYDKSRPRCRV